MMQSFLDWLDHRTGHRGLVHDALFERIPSGARFRYVTGSMLVFAFVTQAITGIFLWMAYSPSSTTAFESVFYIQHEMTGGWLLRGIHHFMAQAMVVTMGLHLLQVVWDGAYRPPREFNYWIGLVLMLLVMGLGLTGYLLPWDQKGFWATNVATNLMTLSPGVGKELQQLAVGGSAYGHHTLTRFFAMHAGVLPVLLIGALGLHIALFRRHGITAKITPGRPDEFFWPKQVLFDSIGCLVLLTIVLLCVIHFDVKCLVHGKLPPEHRGADLSAPADPAEQYSAARPEWYYLFLFQLLKYFPGSSEIIGAIVIPTIAMVLLFLLPILGRWNFGHLLSRAFIVLLIGAAGVLTGLAMLDDNYAWLGPKLGLKDEKKITASEEFLKAKEDAEHNSKRTVELINRREMRPDGTLSDVRLIPKEGAVSLLRNDPLIQGPRLFGQHCASCHGHADDGQGTGDGGQGTGGAVKPSTAATEQTAETGTRYSVLSTPPKIAPNLFSFASRRWTSRLLDHAQIVAPNYLGNTAHKDGRMATWLKQNAAALKQLDTDAIAAALSAQAQLPAQRDADAKDAELIRKGVGLIEQNCTRGCHKFGEHGQLGLAPDLTGYGSYEWMMGLVSDPTHERFYRQENDRMPSFAKDFAHPEQNNLSVREISLIVDWLRGDYYRPDDKAPVLPHDEDAADRAVSLARTVSNPWTSIVGAGPQPPENNRHKAERLFASNCAACHSITPLPLGEGGERSEPGEGGLSVRPSAPNLHAFASRSWLTGLLDPKQIKSDRYFGNTRHIKGEMVGFVNDNLAELDDDGKAKLQAIIAALSAEAALPAQKDADQKAEADGTLTKGRKAIGEAFESSSCVDCHKFRESGDLGSAPDLTGWGSKDWLVRFISDPTHEAFYRDTNDRMPSFGKSGPGPTRKSLLTAEEIDLLARYLRGEEL
jgi:quinol-cytochrome oxidoreductase complex cytochrome b subunit/mono/diheme cytochrome c family protein